MVMAQVDLNTDSISILMICLRTCLMILVILVTLALVAVSGTILAEMLTSETMITREGCLMGLEGLVRRSSPSALSSLHIQVGANGSVEGSLHCK